MPVETYETLFLLDSTKVSNDAEAVKNTLHHIIECFGGQVTISRPWDYNHKLTYPIRKSKKGAFHIVYYTLDSLKQIQMEREFKLAPDLILRHMTLNIDPKWADTVLGVARDDAGTGFAVRGMQEESGDGTMSFGDGDGERRRGRPEAAEKPE